MIALFGGVSVYFDITMPDYGDSAGDDNYTEKITGLYLVRHSAAQGDNLIMYCWTTRYPRSMMICAFYSRFAVKKGIEPLFVHVPLHGQWSDYTGFTADKRQQYYTNVRDIVNEYGINMLDLTGYEYEEYFMFRSFVCL